MTYSQKNSKKFILIYTASVALFVLSFITAVALGASEISIYEVLKSLFGINTDSATANIVRHVRLPRALGALVCGAALAVSGAVIQGVLANRLASPSIIGVNSGAGLSVTVASALGVIGGVRFSLIAFLGAFLAVMLVAAASRKWRASKGTVILMGVALNSLLGAFSDTVTTFSPEVSIMSNDFKIGDFSSVTYNKLLPAAAVIIIAFAVLLTLVNELDVISLGDENAKGLGLNVGAMRFVFLTLSAFLAGAAVSICGLLSFVGLLVPHTVRRIATSEAKHLLPLSALIGGGFVALCDTLSRTVFAPYEIPVGIIMAFLGAPFFIYVLLKGDRGHD